MSKTYNIHGVTEIEEFFTVEVEDIFFDEDDRDYEGQLDEESMLEEARDLGHDYMMGLHGLQGETSIYIV